MAKSATDLVLRGKLTSVQSQRVPYKPYGYELAFDNVWVQLSIPRSGQLEVDGNNVVLSLDGLNALLQVTADSIDKLDAAHQAEINKKFGR